MKKTVVFSGYLLIIFGAISMLAPFIWMLCVSFMTEAQIFSYPPNFIPHPFITDNYIHIFEKLPITRFFINSLLVALLTTVFQVLFSAMAGYAFAKIDFPFKKVLFGLVLLQMMLPSQIFLIPQYQMLAKVELTESIFGLVFPGLVSAFGTFFLRQAYMGIPNEIAEAAQLDGCTKLQKSCCL